VKLAIHTQALQEILDFNCNPITGSSILASKIAITPSLLNKYSLALGGNVRFQQWFLCLNAAKRLSIHLPQAAPACVQAIDPLTDDFGTAAYFGGSTLVAESAHLNAGAPTALSSIGVNVLSAKKNIAGTVHGDNPFFAIALFNGGSEGFSQFDRFIKPEENVVVYDKYINNESVELLEHLVTKMAAGSALKIFHSTKTGTGLLSTTVIQTRVQAANPTVSVSCKQCHHAFTKTEHDRYMFLGRRIQIVFTVGLDCFGKINAATGNRINRESKILFFDVASGDPLDIEALDGSLCTVNHLAEAL
jgi:hypothetical protein